MRKISILILLLVPLLTQAQKITSYKAANGITYHLNDTVRLGKGSGDNGSFLYIEQRGPIPSPHSSPGLPKTFTNSGVIIKNIKKDNVNGIDKYLFIVGAGGPFRFSVYIDDAILACEVTPCQATTTPKQPVSVADEIKKLKELLDSGALTQAEFDSQKRKLLGE